MFFWRRVAPQIPEEGLKPTATPGYSRNFRDLNDLIARGKSFSGYERNLMFLNQSGNGFAEVAGLFQVDFDDDARAVAQVDWDRDGDLDLWITNRSAPQVRLLRNNQPSTNAFVAIRLIGNGSTTNRDAVGARLSLSSGAGSSSQIRTVHAGDGFLTQSSVWNHFGLGQATEDLKLTVSWPGGGTETYTGLKAGTHYTITQGEGLTRELSAIAWNRQTAIAPGTEPPAANERSGFWVANRVPFPRLEFKKKDGTFGSTTDFLGKPVLVNFWATWCVPCLAELRDFASHAEGLQTQNATVLALNVDDLAVEGSASPAGTPEEVLTRVGYRLPSGLAGQDSLAKIEILIEYLSSRRRQLAIPASFLVDAEGYVAAVYLEPVRWEQLSADLALLNADSVAQLQRATPRPGLWLADPRQILDRAAYLGDYATVYGKNGFAEESQRLYQMLESVGGSEDARAYYNRAKTAAAQGLTQQAVELYQTAVRLDPEYGPALTGLGALLLLNKQADEAQRLFERALALDPNHATALINLATIDQSRGDNERALARLQQVVGRNPGYAQAQLNLGSLLGSMRRHDEAIGHLTKAVELAPDLFPAHVNLAVAYMQTKRWDEAESHYRRALELNPRMAGFCHFGIGNVQSGQGKHADAVASYRQAISQGAKNAQIYTQLGRTLAELGEKQAAIDAFRQALELDPKNETAQRALQALTKSPSM